MLFFRDGWFTERNVVFTVAIRIKTIFLLL